MTQTDQQNVPRLRFPGFDAPLDSVKLGDVATFSKGKGISKNDIDPDGSQPCIRYGELYTLYDTIIDQPISKTSIPVSNLKLSKGDEVLVPASGEDAKDIATAVVVKRPGVALGGDLNIIQSKNDGAFLASYLSGKRRMTLAAMAQGNSVVHLYPAQLKLLNLNLPTLPEQRKIADFLSAVDTKIAQLSEKKRLLEDYKKGCMQQLFSQKIRFKDEDGNDFPDWEKKRLGEISTAFSGGTPSSSNRAYYDGDIPFIGSGDISAPCVKQRINKVALTSSSAKLVNAGDLLYALYGATSGEVAISRISGAINQAVLCIRSAENTQFLFPWLRHSKEKITATYLQGGQGNLSGKIVKALLLSLPHLDEQRKIADFLSALDHKIALVAEEHRQAQTFKKGLLQQMFV
jgi:type I restriction enzyme S subunit